MENQLELIVKKTREKVKVYCQSLDGTIVWSNSQNAFVKYGWKSLVPVDYNFEGILSKTQRNKIKSFLKLVDATWECTDGIQYTHTSLEDAIKHQEALLNINKTIML